MTALLVVASDPASTPSLPPVVWRKIAAFLAAGTTGQIVLDVKEGRILAYKLTESGRVPAGEIDSHAFWPHDSER